MCKNWKEKGTCRYGEKCLFAHGEHELTRKSSCNESESKPKSPVKVIDDLTEKSESATKSLIDNS